MLHLLTGEVAARGNVAHQVRPQVVEQLLQILARLGTEILARVGFHGRLVFADARYLHADAEFLKRAGHEQRLDRQALKQDCAERVEHHVTGNRRQVIIPGRGVVEIGHHGFARLLERRQGGAHLLERAVPRAIVDRPEVPGDEQAGDAAVFCGGTDRAGDGAQLQRRPPLAAKQRAEHRSVELRRRILDVGRQVEHQVGALGHRRGLPLPHGRHRHQKHEPDKRTPAKKDDQGHKRAKERREETLHGVSS